MPSLSLFLRSSATLISILSLFSAPTSAASSSTKYTNVKTYSGNGFYDGFNFFTDADPTHGFVTYVDKNTAISSELTKLEDGAFKMSVDSENFYDPNSAYYGNNGFGRPSVRLESKDTFTKGLFIIDVLHMPGNVCGVWPAFWTTVSANTWPVGGEIDIVESISNRDISMAVLHTSGQSVINSDKSTMSGTVQTTDCRYDTTTGPNAAGCAIANTDPSNYGAGLNSNGGRIFAMEWTDDTVKVWSFPRSSYPSDIDSGNPDPSKWGLPVQNFAGDSANIKDNFFNHKIVINTDFCGDFGDAVWSGEGCAASTGYSTCEAFVANNPAAFADQFWKINSLKVFQRAAAPSSSSSTTSSSTTTSSTGSSTTSTSTTSSRSTTSSGFTTVTLTTSSSTTVSGTTTPASSTGPFGGRTSTPSSFSTSSPTSSFFLATTSRGFTYTNSSSTYPFTSSTSTSSYTDGISTTSTYTTTTPSSSSSWTTPTGTWSTSTSISAPIISATGFPGYAQGGSQQTQNWAIWASPDPTPSFIKTTITTTYFVPCSTGLSTSTVSIVTSYAGGKKVTYAPTLAVTTYTTSCPVEWGFGGVVTVTVPVTTTKTIVSVKTGGSGSGSGNGGSGSGNGSGNGSSNNSGASSSNSNSNSNGSGNASGSTTNNGASNNNNGWSTTASTTTLATTFTARPSLATPDATSKVTSDPAPTAGGYAAVSTGAGSSSGSASASSPGSSPGSTGADWSSWTNSNVTSPIAVYKGDASRMGVSTVVIVVGIAVVGLVM